MFPNATKLTLAVPASIVPEPPSEPSVVMLTLPLVVVTFITSISRSSVSFTVSVSPLPPIVAVRKLTAVPRSDEFCAVTDSRLPLIWYP